MLPERACCAAEGGGGPKPSAPLVREVDGVWLDSSVSVREFELSRLVMLLFGF